MASHQDSIAANGNDVPSNGFEPGLGGAGVDARAEGEAPYLPLEDTPPPEDQPMPPEDQPMPAEGGASSDGPGDFGGTAGTGGVNEVQEMLDR